MRVISGTFYALRASVLLSCAVVKVHRVSKNVPSLGCYSFETWERILIFFGINVTDKVSDQKTYCYATSNNLCFCTTWQNAETRKSHFHLNAVLVHCLNSTSCLISSIFLTHDSHSRCCMTPCVQPAGLLGASFRRKEVESAAGVGLCCMHNAPVRCLLGFLFCKVMQKH